MRNYARLNLFLRISSKMLLSALLAGPLLVTEFGLAAEQPGTAQDTGHSRADIGSAEPDCERSSLGSPYIPVDSWVYPAMMRLYALGFTKNVYLGMRPWTRISVVHMLEGIAHEIQVADDYGDPTVSEARKLYAAVKYELRSTPGVCAEHQHDLRLESAYSVVRAISGTSLRDSFHLGSTIVNDYGRPYESGFNNYSGDSGYAAAGRFVLYARGEFQGAPSATGYSPALAQTLSALDEIPYLNSSGTVISQATIPEGPIAATAAGRVVEAYASAQYLNHVISFGKQDDWLGPGQGGAMAYSNNAENIYTFRINRIEPLNVPLLSKITGPFRYEFLVGSLKGHTYPNDPWIHIEKVSFRPTQNLEFGFERTVIWGGEGHVPITIGTFLRSFFSLTAPSSAVKNSRDDPGARFGAFDFSYRLPFVRNWIMLYADSEAHDDVSPADAPRHACYRPGIYISHVPGIPRLDIRTEGISTDPSTPDSLSGRYQYWEGVQRQGYTNKGVLFGDWVGREDKGAQGWVTLHMSGNEWVQVGVRNQKAAKDFIPGGTTLNDINLQVVKRLVKDLEFNGNISYERWKAPVYRSGQQRVFVATMQLTWFLEKKMKF